MAIQPKRHRKADKAEAKRNRSSSKKKNSMGDKAKKSKADSTSIANFLDTAVRAMGQPRKAMTAGSNALKETLNFDNEAVSDSTVTLSPVKQARNDRGLQRAFDRKTAREHVRKPNPKRGGSGPKRKSKK